jgi:surface antigen
MYQRGGGAVWSSATGTPGSHAVMQGDGNLVVYRPDGSAAWGSETDTFDGSNLALQDDGNLVIYQNGRAIWSIKTGKLFQRLDTGQVLGVGQSIKSTDHRFVLVMQGDGNLVMYQGSTPLWNSETGTPNSWAVMQGDGNLVVYRPDGSPAWDSGTADKPGSRLELQNDSNLVIYQGGTAVWDRHHGRIGGGGSTGGSSGGVIGDDYPSYLKDAAQDAVIDPWRFYNRECTSFVAWRLNNTNHAGFSNFMGGGRFGNADNWDNNARSIGITVNATPAVGAVAQNEGHVAWVAAVGSGTVTIEEYNRYYNGTYSFRTVPTSSFVYIHIKDLG